MGAQAEVADSPETETQTAAGTETQATDTAAEITTTPPAEAPSKGETAAGVDSYLAEKAKLLPLLKSAPPAQATEPEEIPEETPAATEEVAAPVAETPPPESTEEPETPESRRIRLAGLPDGHLVAAANEIARAEKISFSEAWDRVAPKKAEPTPEQVEEITPHLRTREDVESDLQKAVDERDAAAAAADALEAGANSRMVKAQKQIETITHELNAVEYAEMAAEGERIESERTEFENIVEESKTKAVEWWPEANDPESSFSKRMIELAEAFENDPDPTVRAWAFDPNSPFVFAQMVAKEQGLLPAHMRKTTSTNNQTKPSTPAAIKPALVNQRAVGRPTQPAASPASGAARTTQGNVEDELGLDRIRSPYDYQKLKARLTGQKA